MANNKDLKDYLHQMIVPSGFRPQTDEEIERALDLFDEGSMDSDTVAKILEKAKGGLPLNYEMDSAELELIEEPAESEELLALHRSGTNEDSDEVNEKLEKYRAEARDEDEADNKTDEEPRDNVD